MLEVTLENIRSIESFSAVFYPGINLIVGKNGVGKTTLCNALHIALHGRMLNSQKNYRNLIKKGSSSGMVHVKMETPSGKHIEIKRHFSFDGSSYKVNIDGNEYKLNPSDLIPAEIVELMYLQLTKFDFLKYFDFESFVENYEEKNKIIEDALIKLDKLIVQKRTMEKIFEKELAEHEEKLKNVITNIKEVQSKIEEIKKNLYFKNYEDFLKFKDLYNAAKEEFIKIVESKKEERKAQVEIVNSQIKTLLMELEKIKINMEKEEKEEISKLMQEKYKEESIINSEFSVKMGAIGNSIGNLQKEKKKISQIHGKNVCPVCGKELDEKEVQRIYIELEKHIQELEAEIEKEKEIYEKKKEELEEKYELLKKEAVLNIRLKYEKILQEKENNINSLKEKYSELHNSVTITEEEKRAISDQIKKKYFKELSNIVNKEFMEEHEKAFLKLKEYDIQLNSLKENKIIIENSIEELKKKIEKSRDTEKIDKILESCKKAKAFLSKINKRDIKRYLSSKIYEIVNDIAVHYSNIFPVKVIPELRQYQEGYTIEFNATNLNGENVPLGELSSGESVIARIIINLVIRDFLRLLPQYKNVEFLNLMFIDEHLDKLDEYNAQNTVEILQSLNNFTFIIVTHRNDLVQSFSFGVSNIITL